MFVKVPGHSGQEEQATFSWERDRLFDRLAVLCLYELCIESPQAEVVELKETEKVFFFFFLPLFFAFFDQPQ